MVCHMYVGYPHKALFCLSFLVPCAFSLLVEIWSLYIEVVRVGLVLTNFLGVYIYFLSSVTVAYRKKP